MTEPYRAPPESAPGKLTAKPAGDYYAVVLRDKDFSLLRVGVAGGIGGGGSFPIPDLGDRCACCNAEATTSYPFDPSTDRLHVEPIAIPVCAPCLGHAKKNTKAAQLVGGSLIPMSLGGAIWTAMNEIYIGTAVATLLGVGVIAWMLHERQKRRETAKNGHHPAIEILVSIGQVSIRTTNKKLAEHLVAHHDGKDLHRAR